jgi:hypothetical protein
VGEEASLSIITTSSAAPLPVLEHALPIQLGSPFENLKQATGPITPLEATSCSNCLDLLV